MHRLAAGDVTGGLRTLDEIGDENHPTVRRLRAVDGDAADLVPVGDSPS